MKFVLNKSNDIEIIKDSIIRDRRFQLVVSKIKLTEEIDVLDINIKSLLKNFMAPKVQYKSKISLSNNRAFSFWVSCKSRKDYEIAMRNSMYNSKKLSKVSKDLSNRRPYSSWIARST